MAQLVHAVAGRPVQASASPLLFLMTVARLEEAGVEGLALATTRAMRIDATSLEEVMEQLSAPPQPMPGVQDAVQARIARAPRPRRANPPEFLAREGRWVSLTSPLKHLIGDWRCTDGAHSLLSVNALRVDDAEVHSAGTDGAGVVALARLAGCGPEGGAVLRLRGGGGAARSVAHAWVNAGGRIHLLEGRRPLTPRPREAAHAGPDEDAVLGIDFDGNGEGLTARKRLIPSYQNKPLHAQGNLTSAIIDGRWMLVAQHLEAWCTLWAPELERVLPSMSELMDDLLALEVLLDDP